MYGFRFSNLLGSSYQQGNVLFTKDGNSFVSPVGDKITIFDLINNKSKTIETELKNRITKIALSKDGMLLLAIDEKGHGVMINILRGVVLHHINFKAYIHDAKFSPCGKFFAITKEKELQVWFTPGIRREFTAIQLSQSLKGHLNDITCLDWSNDGRYIVTGSFDLTVKIHRRIYNENFKKISLYGHKDYIVGVFFSRDNNIIYSVSFDGTLIVWKWIENENQNENQNENDLEIENDLNENDLEIDLNENNLNENDLEIDLNENSQIKKRKIKKIKSSQKWSIKNTQKKEFFSKNGKFIMHSKHYFFPNTRTSLRCVDFHKEKQVLVAGFGNGVFGLYKLPDFEQIHTLNISQHPIDTLSFNATGEWIGLGSGVTGQVLVWEWQSETHILKQQGHTQTMTCLGYSPDGRFIATGGDDGKIKMWNITSGFSFVTFTEHKLPVTDIVFSQKNQVAFSSSLDGTVRALDLVRYRSFRVFTTPTPVQFSCVAVDPSGEIVCAGTMDDFQICVWSVQTGKLLDVISGHEGPVSCLQFSPVDESVLVSGSWDHTVRVWDIFGKNTSPEIFSHNSDVLAVAFHPDGKELATSTLDGTIVIWDIETASPKSTLEIRRDIFGGKIPGYKEAFSIRFGNSHFSSLCYSADGRSLIAGGNSPFVCMYELSHKTLAKRFMATTLMPYGGEFDKLNSALMTEAGEINTINAEDDRQLILEGGISRRRNSHIRSDELPGVMRGELKRIRATRPEIRCVRFSPDGRNWAAVSNEGLVIYSLDNSLVFDPYALDVNITPQSINNALENSHFLKALLMSLSLNKQEVISLVFYSIPPSEIPVIASVFPREFLHKFLDFISKAILSSPHLQFHLIWITNLFAAHSHTLLNSSSSFLYILRSLNNSLSSNIQDIKKLCESNTYTLDYLITQNERKFTKKDSMFFFDNTPNNKNQNPNQNSNQNSNSKKKSSLNFEEIDLN